MDRSVQWYIALIVMVMGILCLSPFSAAANILPSLTIPIPVRTALDQRTIVVSVDGSVTVKRHREIQILTANIPDWFRTLALPRCPATETLKVIKAFTRQSDGTIIDVPDRAITSRAASKGSRCPEEVAIAFPAVKSGSTIVYDTEDHTSAKVREHFSYAATFQKSDAINRLLIEMTLPSNMALTIEAPGMMQSRTPAGNSTTYRFSYANPIDTFDPADMLSNSTPAAAIYVSTFKSYSEFGKAVADPFFPNISVTPTIQRTAAQIVAGATSRREKARRVHEWVVKNIRYEHDFWDDNTPHDASATLSRGAGDCKDHTVLLIALLRAEGIEADLVFLSTTHYDLPRVPVAGGINHVIGYIPEFDIFEDTTAQHTAFGDLPLLEHGRTGLLVTRDGTREIRLPGQPCTAPRCQEIVP